MRRHLPSAAIIVPSVVLLAVYGLLPTHGFMLDDYAWILQARVRNITDLAQIATEDNGFYRPFVALSFAVNELAFGLSPAGYGATNLMLAVASAAGVFYLARGLNIAHGGAAAAALVWLLNFQGIRTAILWLSGRTALLLVLGCTFAAAALLRRRHALSLVFLAVAILSKEEAILLPVVLAGWLMILRSEGSKRSVGWFLVGVVMVEVLYLLARSQTGAMTPASAPEWYQLTPGRIVRNAQIYSDQIATFPLLVTVGSLLALGRPHPLLDGNGRRIAALVAVWIVGSMGLTILVPIRSDLYSVLPSVGTSIMAAYMAARAWNQADDRRRTRALLAVVIGSLVLSPVYYLRTVRRSTTIQAASTALGQLETFTADAEAGSVVSVEDDERHTLTDAFGPHLGAAHELFFGKKLDIRIGPGDDTVSDGRLLLRWADGRFAAVSRN